MLNVFWTLLLASFVETQVGRKFTSLLGQVSFFLHRKVKINCNKRCACKLAFFGNNLDKLLRTFCWKEAGWGGGEGITLCQKKLSLTQIKQSLEIVSINFNSLKTIVVSRRRRFFHSSFNRWYQHSKAPLSNVCRQV